MTVESMSAKMSSTVPLFELTDNDLEFITSEHLPPEDYLWSQIELSANHSKFELCESLLDIWSDQYIGDKTDAESKKKKTKKLSDFLMTCFKKNYDNDNIWYIYQMLRRFKCEALVDRTCLEIELILRNNFDISTKHVNSLLKVAKLSSCNSIDDKVIILLKSLILSKPKIAYILIDLFEDKSSFNFIYSQCLIHGLKNDNKALVLDLIGVYPDEEINKNVVLLEEVCDQFCDEHNEFLLYRTALLRPTPKLMDKLSSLKMKKNRKICYNFDKHCFDFKQCFLLAANHNKHFLSQLLDTENVAFDLPPKQSFFFLIYALHKKDLKIEKFLKIESKLSSLVFDCEEVEAISKSDSFIRSLVNRIRFIIDFAKWCVNRMNTNALQNSDLIRYRIFCSLICGESPLQILLKNGFLSKTDFNDSLIEEISQLLDESNKIELMIYRGFLAISLTIIWIVLNDTEEFEDQIAFLLKKIYPINFRVEILENLFSLLFLTKNELLIKDCEEDEEAMDEHNVSKDYLQSMSLTHSINFGPTSSTPYFLCPNTLVPKLLTMLKDLIVDSQATLFAYNYKKSEDIPKIEMNCSIKDLSECKARLERLMKYVSEAQWRYDVIEPTFSKNHLTEDSNKNEISESGDEGDIDDMFDDKDFMRSFSSESSSGEKDRQSKSGIFSSLISCMLASPKQLLRYSLLEGQTDRAKQVVKLFEHSLQNSEEVRELEIISKWKELSLRLRTLTTSTSTPQKSMSSSKTSDELMSSNITFSQIETILHQLFSDLQVSDETKTCFVIDFALTTSPSIEISELLLDTLDDKQVKNLPDKIQMLLNNMRTMIGEVSKEYDTKTISFAQLLTRYVDEDNFWDSSAYREHKNHEKQLKIAYEELQSHLIGLETRDDFEPRVRSQAQTIKDLKRTNVLFDKLLRLCSKSKYQYLKVLFYYVRNVSKALNECRQRSNSSSLASIGSSYFSILKQSPSAILCSMVLKDGISPKFVDDFAVQMKVDLIGTLCSVLCPKIPSHLLNDCSVNEFVLTESCHPALCEIIESHLRGIKQTNQDLEALMIQNHFEDNDSQTGSFIEEKVRNIDLINYFNTRSPILVEIMKMLKLLKDDHRSNSEFRFRSKSPLNKWIEVIISKFGNVPIGDQTSILSLAFWPRIVSNNSIVIKTLEHYAIKGCLLEMYDLIQYIQTVNVSNSSFMKTDSSFKTLRNALLSRLALEQQEVKYALQMVDDPNTKCDVIIDLIETSNEFDGAYIAVRTLKCCLSSLVDELSPQELAPIEYKLKAKINEIEFYSKIGQLTGLHSWKDAKHNLKGVDILTIIKTKRKYSMAIDWFKIQDWETDTSDLQYELLVLAYCEQNDLSALTQLLSKSDEIEVNVLSLIDKILTLIANFDLRHFLIEFVLKHFSGSLNEDMITYYNNYMTGIKLIKGLDTKIQNNYLNIIAKPMLIIEQMLMNIEYEALEEAKAVLNFDHLIENYAQKAVEIPIYDIPSAGNSVISDATFISSTFVEVKNYPRSFLMPESVPTKEQWIPDANVTHCMICKFEKFSMLNRRHHCRRCGRVICANCSQNTLFIREIKSNSTVRVCDECYVQTQRNIRKESIGSESSSLGRRNIWVLTADDLQNDCLRLEFYYDSSPSVSLCLTLLRLHSDKNRCCKLIIDSICKPLLETVVSSQVDYGLVIGMIRSLLVSTRISMEEQPKSNLMEQLNHLLGRLDVIRLLINSNCNTKELISYALSNSENSIMKLQEKLIEMERFELARDLAAKFGLDSKSIFKTWAFICLKHNQLSEARDKFKSVFDKNKSSEADKNRILDNIIHILSKRKYWSNTSLRDECLQIKKGKHKTRDMTNSSSNRLLTDNSSADLQTKNPKVFAEIMYYLQEYGTNEEIIKFYVKQSLFKRAITLFLNDSNSFSNNFFMKELFMASVKRGCLSAFLRELKACDPALTRVWKHLLALCKYLSATQMFHILHVVQVFMGDHLRAAITQINCFFLSPVAEHYMELHSRLANLQSAKQHCQDFLQLNAIDYRNGCLIMERDEVMRQLRSLNIQIDITVRFNDNRVKGFLPKGVYTMEDSPADSQPPPTILDHNKARKTELAALVTIAYGPQIADGFAVSQMIIKDHNLNSAQVYRLAGRALVQSSDIKVMDCVSQLLQCIQSTFIGDSTLCDDVISASIRSCSEPSLVEPLIKLLSNERNKFDAYIMSAKLKSAYLLAINSKRESDVRVRRVLEASNRLNDLKIGEICERWLREKNKL